MKVLSNDNFTTVIHPKNLSIQIEEQLIDAVNKGAFSVGDYLPSENKLSEIFGVSRGVIREALLMLSAKGIIEIKKGKGAKLLKPSIDTLFDSFSLLINYKCGNKGLKYAHDVRIIIEPYITSLMAEKCEEKDIKTLKACIENMEKFKLDRRKLSFFDIEFHKTISRSCGNPMFAIILEPIFHFLKTFYQETFEDLTSNQITLEFHYKILEAIENKDRIKAFNAMKEHLTIAQLDIDSLYNRYAVVAE